MSLAQVLEAGEKDIAKNKKPTKALIGSGR